MIWYDDSSPYRGKVMELRQKMERAPGKGAIVMAKCHPKRKHCARGYCEPCYFKRRMRGQFKK